MNQVFALIERTLHMIMEDRNMPKDVKKTILRIFPHLKERKY